jgi:hypothetical protein
MWKFISRFTLQNLFFFGNGNQILGYCSASLGGDFSCVHGQAYLALSLTADPGNGCYTSGWWVYAAMWACVWERTW